MRRFATLLDRLSLTPSRNGKLRLIEAYLAEAPDPDRGWGLAAITGDLRLDTVKPAMLRALIAERADPELFALSHDFVGDLAETIALMWPEGATPPADPPLGEVVAELRGASRREAPRLVERRLDALDAPARFALLKLVTGGLRVGVSARLAKQALADFGGRDVNEIEEVWHGLEPPYAALFAWLGGTGARPAADTRLGFRPVMLSHPLEEADRAKLDPADFRAEWKWDGIRVQASAGPEGQRLYSRTGEEISRAFPDLVEAMRFDATLDGELLVARPEGLGAGAAPFGDLQRRLNRKTVTAREMGRFPAFLRLYDLLREGGEDLRPAPFDARRARLEAFAAGLDRDRFDLSPLIGFESWAELARERAAPPEEVIEGVMLKRRDSPYLAGRPAGHWYKWKRDPRVIDAVLMYAQRGHGKRSGYYSDYTFGVWAPDGALVPVGKAYFGFTDEELVRIDRFVRDNTVERFGPVRAVRAEPGHGLVLEVAFEGLNRSTRHKSGVAMRFPRISRLRWDKPPSEADRIEALEALLPPGDADDE
ncbi:cisplatin damage response ATP-dependent DNA ligase [Amaricoccus solimangrovi]|uniref:DNA ligase (ATP) n=1 Tax=Amaricoccus solimangrovi TaxID=2589815 RepID=A0A501WRX9_9RHOB|nr:cisplatin damage response ATP-dependent DNA ligase [Amaricoccus solimangrovi]TPE52229.1 cisplatin damage response ATP-dependent DNA ligase [Amaricoccus solimangrovi]